jgi:hypothetical protein
LKSDKLRRNRPKQAGLWEPFLHKYTNWCCLRIRTFAHPASANRSGSHIKERHKFD